MIFNLRGATHDWTHQHLGWQRQTLVDTLHLRILISLLLVLTIGSHLCSCWLRYQVPSELSLFLDGSVR